MTVKRTSQVVIEALSQGEPPKLRTSQVVIEALSQGEPPKLRASQVVIEVASAGVADGLLTGESIAGTLTKLGAPAPGRWVALYDRVTQLMVSRMQSDIAGDFVFANHDPNGIYYVVALDDDIAATIADRVPTA